MVARLNYCGVPLLASVEEVEEFLSLSRGILGLNGVLHEAIGADHKGQACGVFGVVLGTGTVGQRQFSALIAQKRKLESILLRERAIGLGGVKRHAQDLNIALSVLRGSITEPLALGCSPRGTGLWIEPKDVALAHEVRRAALHTLVVRQRERGSRFSRRHD